MHKKPNTEVDMMATSDDYAKVAPDDFTNDVGVDFIEGDIKPTPAPEFVEMTTEDESIIRGAA